MNIKSHNPAKGGLRGQEGFTIIEVSLFLAISAVLAVVLLFGWSTMLNTQRYKDSVRTLQSFVQQQYNLTYNVENEHGTNLGCDNNAVVTDNGAPDNPSVGQSDCVIMGRYITIKDGQKLSVSSIVGHEPEDDEIEPDMTEYDVISLYSPKRVEQPIGLSEEQLTVPWDAYITDVGGDLTKRNHAFAIVRGPSGIVHTFVSKNIPNPDVPPQVSVMITASAEAELNLCLDPGSAFSGGRMGVLIQKGASSQSSILQIADGDDVC